MNPPIHFVTGLPRSGTTLMMNLLGQNPAHHVTPTSGLIRLVQAVLARWTRCSEFRAQGLAAAKPHVLGALRGLMAGFFEQPIAEGKTVFDKSRGWLQYIEPVEEIFERRIVLVTLVRDVRAIVASWEMLYRRRGIEYRDSTPRREKRIQSATDRARYVLHPRRVTGRSIGRLRDALDRCPDRLLIVPYERLTAQPVETIRVVHRRLGLPDFQYDPDHVEQVTYEDDVQIGLPLHTIRPRIESPPAASWEDVLPGPLCKRIAERYADINRLAAGDVVNIVDTCD